MSTDTKFKHQIFKQKVRWNFRFAMHGYGENVKQALKDALDQALFDLENHSIALDAVEKFEVDSIQTDDVETETEDIP